MMKLRICLFLLAVFFTHQLSAQSFRVSVAPELNFPTGNASNVSGIGFGGSAKAEISVFTKYAITANAGYNYFIGKKYFGNRTPSLEAIPLKMGLKYYSFSDFYVEGQGGVAIRQGDETSDNAFAWSVGLGTLMRTGGEGKFDFGLRYEAWSNSYKATVGSARSSSFGFIGLKLGYLLHQ